MFSVRLWLCIKCSFIIQSSHCCKFPYVILWHILLASQLMYMIHKNFVCCSELVWFQIFFLTLSCSDTVDAHAIVRAYISWESIDDETSYNCLFWKSVGGFSDVAFNSNVSATVSRFIFANGMNVDVADKADPPWLDEDELELFSSDVAAAASWQSSDGFLSSSTVESFEGFLDSWILTYHIRWLLLLVRCLIWGFRKERIHVPKYTTSVW